MKNPSTPLVRIKDKFQVTLPISVRKALNLAEGDYCEITMVDGIAQIKPATAPTATSGSLWYQQYRSRNKENSEASKLSDKEVVSMVKELR